MSSSDSVVHSDDSYSISELAEGSTSFGFSLPSSSKSGRI